MIRDIYPPRVEFDFTKGSLQDQSTNGYATTLTPGDAYWGKGEKGRHLVFGGNTDIDLGNVADFDNDEVQSFAAVFSTTETGIQMIMIKSDGAVIFPGWAMYISGGQIFFRIYQTTTATGFRISTDDTFNDGEEHTVVVTYGGLNGLSKGGGNVKIYVDNQLVDTTLAQDVAFTVSTLNSGNWVLGEASYGSLWFDGPIRYAAQFGVEFTPQEATQLLTELNTAIPYNLTDVKSVGNYVNILPDGNMEDTGTDTYASFNSATVTKETDSPHSGGKYLKISYNGVASPGARVNDQVQVGKTYRFTGWAKSDGTWTPQINDFSGVFWEGTTSTDWQRFDVIKEWTNAGLDFILYHSGQTSGYTAWDDINIFECEPDGTPKYMKAYIADGKGWNESVANVTSGQIENTGFTLQSGFWKVNDEDGFNKNLTCVSNGLATRPSSQVYGTWEFDFKRTTNADIDYISFVSDRIGATVEPIGYHLLVTDYGATQDTVALRRSTGVGATLLFVGEAGIITSGEWYKFRITRDASGVFKIYMKGATDADYVLLTASGGSNPSTDNTYTICTHLNLDLDTGNIRNFKFIPYIQ